MPINYVLLRPLSLNWLKSLLKSSWIIILLHQITYIISFLICFQPIFPRLLSQQNWIQVKPFCYVAETINTDAQICNPKHEPGIIDLENVSRADNGMLVEQTQLPKFAMSQCITTAEWIDTASYSLSLPKKNQIHTHHLLFHKRPQTINANPKALFHLLSSYILTSSTI